MLVGVCGFGSTGSGAVMDLLREFEEVKAGGNMEMSFLYDPNGVKELEYRLVKCPIRFYSGDAAIKSFKRMMYSYDLSRYVKRYMPLKEFREIVDEYISELIVMHWEGGLWHYDRRQVSKLGYMIKYWLGGKFLRVFDKLHIKQPQKFWNDKMYIPVHDERFYKATKQFTSRLIAAMNGDAKEIIAIDQPFPSNNPCCCFDFFEQECKAIVVNRDPRDVYLLSKMGVIGWEMRFTPTYSVEDFISYYRDQMSLIKIDDERVLYVQFEDLIYEYEKEIERIKAFLNIDKHNKQYSKFNPNVSIANTQLALRYPEYSDEIKKIEDSLAEYLYTFDESKADLNSKMWIFKKE